MTWTRVAVVYGVLAILVGYLALIDGPMSEPTAQPVPMPPTNSLLGTDAEAVRAMTLRKDGRTVRATREDGRWRALEPPAARIPPDLFDATIAALTGRIDVRFADTTLIDLAAGGTPVDLEFAYTLSAQSKLVLTAHEVYLPKPKLAVEGPGGVQASFDFRGAKNTAAGRMLTVTLTNDLDGTVYG